MERVGVFGGTFDPIHNGHLSAALQAHTQLQLDKVLFVVSGQPWQKENVHLSAYDRWMLTDVATSDLSWAETCDLEVYREGPTYTIDTLRALQRPDQELFLLVGSDQYHNMQTWKDVDEIDKYATIHVMDRWLNLSSTALRERIKSHLPVDFLVPEWVARHIAMFGLYK